MSSENLLLSGRQRKSVAGRKPLEHSGNDLIDAIDRLVEPTECGDHSMDHKSPNNIPGDSRAGDARANQDFQGPSFIWLLASMCS